MHDLVSRGADLFNINGKCGEPKQWLIIPFTSFNFLFSQNCSDNEDDIEEEMESNAFGEGAVLNDFDRQDDSLIKMEDIMTMDIRESSMEENDGLQHPEMEYLDPKDSITKEDENSLLKTAIQLEPERHEISHPLQITAGSTSCPNYVKAVMLMITSNMRVLRLTRTQEIQLEILSEGNHKEPNAALDAWLVIHGKRRPQFDIEVLVKTFPGVKKYLKDYQGTAAEGNDENPADNADLHGDGEDAVSECDSDNKQEDGVDSTVDCDDKDDDDDDDDNYW